MLVADDHAAIQAAVSQLLSPTCDVVGYAADTATLLATTLQLRPDVILLDLSLRGEMNGLETCRRLRVLAPRTRVVVFTAHDDAELREAASNAGGAGFVWKPRAADDLVPTIEKVTQATPGRTAEDTTA